MSVLHCCLGGRRTGGYNDRPSSFDSGVSKSSYGGGRNDGYSMMGYGSYGSTFKSVICLSGPVISVSCLIYCVSEKRSQYTFPHIFSKCGMILAVRFLGNLLMQQRSNSSPLLLYVSTLPCKTE